MDASQLILVGVCAATKMRIDMCRMGWAFPMIYDLDGTNGIVSPFPLLWKGERCFLSLAFPQLLNDMLHHFVKSCQLDNTRNCNHITWIFILHLYLMYLWLCSSVFQESHHLTPRLSPASRPAPLLGWKDYVDWLPSDCVQQSSKCRGLGRFFRYSWGSGSFEGLWSGILSVLVWFAWWWLYMGLLSQAPKVAESHEVELSYLRYLMPWIKLNEIKALLLTLIQMCWQILLSQIWIAWEPYVRWHGIKFVVLQ